MDAHRSNLLSIAGLLVLTFIMFGDVLFAGGTRVLSDRAADLALQYYSWRDFGFSELAKGHLALWNPYIFGGAPFFGGTRVLSDRAADLALQYYSWRDFGFRTLV